MIHSMMYKLFFLGSILTTLMFGIGVAIGADAAEGTEIKLPDVITSSATSIEKALLNSQSKRNYKEEPLDLAEVGQMLWATQGVVSLDGSRTVPSAGANYPVVVYLVASDVIDLDAGVYEYIPKTHSLKLQVDENRHEDLAQAAPEQEWVEDNPAILVLTANFDRTTAQYGERGRRYVLMEIGHAAQNTMLQAVSLNLGTVPIGFFDEKAVTEALQLPDQQQPLYLFPLGKVE